MDRVELKARLEELLAEHRALDEKIADLHDSQKAESLTLKRLKKRKLSLRDEISTIENALLPDIIA